MLPTNTFSQVSLFVGKIFSLFKVHPLLNLPLSLLTNILTCLLILKFTSNPACSLHLLYVIAYLKDCTTVTVITLPVTPFHLFIYFLHNIALAISATQTNSLVLNLALILSFTVISHIILISHSTAFYFTDHLFHCR
jgi:hypothetical protein